MSLVLLHLSYCIALFYMHLLNARDIFLIPLQSLCHFSFETSHCGSKVIHVGVDFGADILHSLNQPVYLAFIAQAVALLHDTNAPANAPICIKN